MALYQCSYNLRPQIHLTKFCAWEFRFSIGAIQCLSYLLQTTFIDWKTDFDQKILSKKKLTTAIVDVSNGSQSVCDNPFIPYATVINTIVFLLRKFQVR